MAGYDSLGFGRTGDKAYVTGNIHNVPLSDPRLEAAGIDPNSLLGEKSITGHPGISEAELQERLRAKKATPKPRKKQG